MHMTYNANDQIYRPVSNLYNLPLFVLLPATHFRKPRCSVCFLSINIDSMNVTYNGVYNVVINY